MENRQPVKCLVCQLGLIAFPKAMDFEHRLKDLMFEEKIGDVLLIFEHPPTVTLGKFGNMANVLVSTRELQQRGIAFYDSDRGGDATFNCPGQLVIHPIINLKLRGAKAYIADLSAVASGILSEYGIMTDISPAHPGVWIKGQQIGAVGLHISHGISMHGLSLNVNPDLRAFKTINLCGIPGKCATSIENEIGHKVSVAEVKRKVQYWFSQVFHVELVPVSIDRLRKICFEQAPSQTPEGKQTSLV